MKAQLWGTLAIFFHSALAMAAGKYCDAPDYLVRAPASMPNGELATLLTPEEKKNEAESIERLFKKPGPYGHSELGFRYLARAFGFQGDTSNKTAVDLWIAQREATNRLYRGSFELWNAWAREPEMALKPRHAEANFISFFPQPLDSVEYSSCLGTALSRLRCENYLGRAIEANSRVYFGSENSRSPCSVHHMGGKLSGETPDSMEASSVRVYKTEGGTEVTEKKSYKWEFKAYTAGAAKSATGLEQGTAGAPTAK